MDVKNMEFKDESFDLIIDKGTLDAVLVKNINKVLI
jgi:molybdate-binding protein